MSQLLRLSRVSQIGLRLIKEHAVTDWLSETKIVIVICQTKGHVLLYMETLLTILLSLSLLAVLGVLFTGLFAFVKGGEFHEKYGNKLMQWRVKAQSLAIGIVLLLVLVRAAGD